MWRKISGGPLILTLTLNFIDGFYFIFISVLIPVSLSSLPLLTGRVGTPSSMSASREYSQSVASRPAPRVPVLEFASL